MANRHFFDADPLPLALGVQVHPCVNLQPAAEKPYVRSDGSRVPWAWVTPEGTLRYAPPLAPEGSPTGRAPSASAPQRLESSDVDPGKTTRGGGGADIDYSALEARANNELVKAGVVVAQENVLAKLNTWETGHPPVGGWWVANTCEHEDLLCYWNGEKHQWHKGINRNGCELAVEMASEGKTPHYEFSARAHSLRTVGSNVLYLRKDELCARMDALNLVDPKVVV